ncbi:endonuclease/exonuclease/phosphatase family metal-dependent hydrolase [Gelidibacter sediminis]|uniref:Endonuclease/exonuclease/phosphatase family metal-dependent hydrolase n=1 Tax=Gelidibacter sediminis TaxID=1608710 RepID=A0A4R7PZ58_9FLAO|nr:endonuclease/exonuclease/phosphatase family protein [Gelidibacter sediminis]TDU39559.1 endonuclease/exonuclease/phosphatase family metal-dependent hydrolase [Gelidibacter sediminis]
MKKRIGVILAVTLILTGCKSFDHGQLQENGLRVMTYNLRLDTASDNENAWSNRKAFVSSQIMFLEPDILGVQEARPNQVTDLKEALTDYMFIGQGRDGGQEGEHAGIYYNSKKVSVEQDQTFWLSTTPDTVSKGWDAAYPRVCTFGLFRLKQSKQKFWVFNTHLDHDGQVAQKEGLLLILEKIKNVNRNNYPVILMGDFNIEPDSEIFSRLKPYYKDSRLEAAVVFGPEGTFNAFKYHEPVTRRIDYILVSNDISVQKYGTLSSAIDFRFPSDHFPVFVQIMLK